jgi:hypothetical protein
MKITFTRGELKTMASGLSKIIPTRAGLQVLTCVRFAVLDGTLTAGPGRVVALGHRDPALSQGRRRREEPPVVSVRLSS